MTTNEKILFKELCSFRHPLTTDFLKDASPELLGHLFYNRMQGIAYGQLKTSNSLNNVNREFKTSLAKAYEQNIIQNKSYRKCLEYISNILKNQSSKVVMLKGAYLCLHYPEGYRTSNDIDLLLAPEDVSTIGNILIKEGFKQGNIKNGQFIEATRKEIISSKMLRGETVPYIKEVNLPYLKYLEVDLNFSLDYKNSSSHILKDLLNNSITLVENGVELPLLNKTDFFIHLCVHLYKEATTLPWIEMKRDMTLYKYCDIYFLLSEMNAKDIKDMFIRAEKLGIAQICAYAILETSKLFLEIPYDATVLAFSQIVGDQAFMRRIIDPSKNKTYLYQTYDTETRFFLNNRLYDLKEEQ